MKTRTSSLSLFLVVLLAACAPDGAPLPGDEVSPVQQALTTVTFLNHTFSSRNGWLDVTELPSYRGAGNTLFQTTTVSGAPGGSALSVKDALQGAYGANYPQKGAAALDYKFASPISRSNGTITIEWAMKVESVNQNENNRFMVVLLNNMTKKADLSTVDTYTEGPYTTAGSSTA